MDLKPINVKNWINENEKFFLPPVCNKLMHNDQLKVFFVGGPNKREDYHLEEGEELFYMTKGDMCLKVIEKGKHKNVIIKEGEIFLLPSKIPHSPQRKENTIGLVVERERLQEERDALLYFIDGTNGTLYERWFHCEDLGTQLEPLMKEFLSSEEYRTGRPSINSKPSKPYYYPNKTIELMKPFKLNEWIENNANEINYNGYKSLFGNHFETKAFVFGGDKMQQIFNTCETFLFQLRDTSAVEFESKYCTLGEGDTLLLPKGMRCALKSTHGSYTLVVSMPANK